MIIVIEDSKCFHFFPPYARIKLARRSIGISFPRFFFLASVRASARRVV
jgi:hypothetical protein